MIFRLVVPAMLCRMVKQLDVVPFGATYSRAAGLSFKPCPTACLTIGIFAVPNSN
jgi:hypothetical protein